MGPSRYVTTMTMCAFDCAVASTATALYAIASPDISMDSIPDLRTQLMEVLSVFGKSLSLDDGVMKQHLYHNLGSLRAHTQRDGLNIPTFVASQAVYDIAECLVKIFEKPDFRNDDEVTAAAVAMATVYKEACEGYEEYSLACGEFDKFIANHSTLRA